MHEIHLVRDLIHTVEKQAAAQQAKRVNRVKIRFNPLTSHSAEHVQLADEVICIGKTLKSYESDWHRVISAAEISEVDAIHPGDGPLSTHERFAEVCAEIGVQFLRSNAEQGGFT